jgi:VIT1/CCC1 family predicted Fe2+/Mn2+ transporter
MAQIYRASPNSQSMTLAVGAILPLPATTVTPAASRIAVIVIAVLAATGAISAGPGQAPRGPAAGQNVVGGLLAMGITDGIGSLAGHLSG